MNSDPDVPDAALPGRNGRRPGGRSERVRKAVFAAAVEELTEFGLDGLSIPRVAARSGVHMSTIYRRWENPIHLSAAAIVNTVDWSVRDPRKKSLRNDLLALLGEVADVARQPVGRLMLQLATRQDQPGYEVHLSDKLLVTRLAAGEDVLARAKRRGELPEGVDPELLLERLIAPIHMRILLTHQPVDSDFIRQLVDQTLHWET